MFGASQKVVWYMSLHPGPNVARTQDRFLRHHHFIVLYLDAKLPLVNEGLLYRRHRPTNCAW
jgi:hypothetical protein